MLHQSGCEWTLPCEHDGTNAVHAIQELIHYGECTVATPTLLRMAIPCIAL